MNIKKTKKAIAFVLSAIINLSMQISSAYQVAIPRNNLPIFPPSSIQTHHSKSSTKSIEKKMKNILNPTKKEMVKKSNRKALAVDNSGKCGDNVNYTFTASSGELIIYGEGKMNYDLFLNSPWESYKDSIKSVKIKNGVTSIGKFAFSDCSSLTSILIPNSVTSIELSAFSSSGLNSVNIPDSVTYLAPYAFHDCKNLLAVTISNSITVIYLDTFSNCCNLKEVVIPNSVTSIEDGAFCCCENLTSITIPSSVKSIGAATFSYCDKLTSIKIPASVTSISNCVFENCIGLIKVIYEGTSDPGASSYDVFYNAPVYCVLVPTGYTSDTFCGRSVTKGSFCPTPTPSPKPTQTPRPTPTPSPKLTQTPSSTPTPSPRPTNIFKPYRFKLKKISLML